MKTKISVLIAIALCICFSTVGCTSLVEKAGGLKPSTRSISRDYKVKSFNGLNANTVSDIHYTQSTDGKSHVNISGPDNYVELVRVTVKDNTLCLNMDKQNTWGRTKKLTITIASPTLTNISFKGVGNVIIKEKFATDELKIASHGVGSIEIDNLTCQTLQVRSTGVGDILLKGKSKNTVLESRGVGNIDAEELESNHITASSYGVGDITCYAIQTLEANVRGVGSIRHKGEPSERKSLNSKGVGSIKRL